MELIGLVARRKRHSVELGDVPAFDDVPAAAGVVAQAFDDLRNLVDARAGAEGALPCWLIGGPVHPLLAIDRAEVAPLRGELLVLDDARFEGCLRDLVAAGLAVLREGPIAPDRHPLLQQRSDVRLAGEKPQHLAR